MAATALEELVDVVVISSHDKKKRELFSLEPTETVSQIKKQWSDKYNVNVNEISILNANNEVLHDDVTIQEFIDCQTSLAMMKLFVENNIDLRFSIYKSKDNLTKKMFISPSELPNRIFSYLRQQFDISPDRDFRLLLDRKVIVDSKPFRESGIESDAHLHIDLAFDADLQDSWDAGQFRTMRVHSSDGIGVLTEDEREKLSVVAKKKIMDADKEVIDAVASMNPDLPQQISLAVASRRRLVSRSSNSFKEHFVWPSETVGKMLGTRASASEVMMDGRVVSKADKLTLLETSPDSLVLINPLKVTLKLTSGRLHRVRIPSDGAVIDLRRSVESLEGHNDFDLMHHGKRLTDDYVSIGDVPIEDGDQVDVSTKSLVITIILYDCEQEFITRNKAPTFSDLTEFLKSKKKLKKGSNMKLVSLKCEGCSRTLTVEQQEFQTVPVNCCKIKSQRLRLCLAKICDASTQTDFSPPGVTGKQAAIEDASTQTDFSPPGVTGKQAAIEDVSIQMDFSSPGVTDKQAAIEGMNTKPDEEEKPKPLPRRRRKSEDLLDTSPVYEPQPAPPPGAADRRAQAPGVRFPGQLQDGDHWGGGYAPVGVEDRSRVGGGVYAGGSQKSATLMGLQQQKEQQRQRHDPTFRSVRGVRGEPGMGGPVPPGAEAPMTGSRVQQQQQRELIPIAFSFDNYTSHIYDCRNIKNITFRLPLGAKVEDLKGAIALEFQCSPTSFRIEGYRTTDSYGREWQEIISMENKKRVADASGRVTVWSKLGGKPGPMRYHDDMTIFPIPSSVILLYLFNA